MHELLVLARLRDAVGEIVTLFQIPHFSVALEDTGNMVPDVFGELKPETIVLGSAPTEEEIEQWCKDVKRAFENARQELASCRSLVTSRTPKFQVDYTKSTLEGFEENVLPVLAEIVTSQHLHDYVEGLKQRRGELDGVLSDFTYESKAEAAEGKPDSPATVSPVERVSLEAEQPALVPTPTEDTSAKAALNRLNRFVELMEATNAKDEIGREQSYGREPSTELVETAKPWTGTDSIEELRGLAESLATEAEFYKCSEGGQYLSLVACNYWQCHQRGHSAENAMMVGRTIAELRAKLLAAIRHEESNQLAKPERAGKSKPVEGEKSTGKTTDAPSLLTLATTPPMELAMRLITQAMKETKLGDTPSKQSDGEKEPVKPLLPQQKAPQPKRADRIVADGASPLTQYVDLLIKVPEKLELALGRDEAAVNILKTEPALPLALARAASWLGDRFIEKQTGKTIRSRRIWTRRDERRVNMLRGFGGGGVPACRAARYIAWLEPGTGPSLHDQWFRRAVNEARQDQTIGVLGEKLERAKTAYARMIAVARLIAEDDEDRSAFTAVHVELGSITCELMDYTKAPAEANDKSAVAPMQISPELVAKIDAVTESLQRPPVSPPHVDLSGLRAHSADAVETPESATEGSQQSDAQRLASLKPSERKAWGTWLMAKQDQAVTLTDREAYDWLKEGDDDLFIGELVDYKLPTFPTWQRQLRTARNAMGQQKNTPRAGRVEGRSIARKSDF